MRSFLLILSSPSGGGKTTIAQALLNARDDLGYSVSATTRAPRLGERDGVDYRFLSTEEFGRRRTAGEFLEWAEYSGYLYGTLAAEVDRLLQDGRHVVMDIEVHGARQIRERRANVVSIFILPPSARALWERLGGRSSEDVATLRRRMLRAAEEVMAAVEYDYIVVNDDRAEAVAEVAGIIDAETHRASRQSQLQATLTTLHDELSALAERLAAAQE